MVVIIPGGKPQSSIVFIGFFLASATWQLHPGKRSLTAMAWNDISIPMF